MDETESDAPSTRKAEEPVEMWELTLAIAEIASIQMDMLRGMERAVRNNAPQVNLGIGGVRGHNIGLSIDPLEIDLLKSRTQEVLSWLLDKAKEL